MSGAAAANVLGLSTQVPAKPTYATDGPSRSKKVGGRTVVFKRSSVPLIDGISDKANLTLQALAHIGKDNVDNAVLQRCANVLTDRDLQKIMAHIDRTPSWMADFIHKIKKLKETENDPKSRNDTPEPMETT